MKYMKCSALASMAFGYCCLAGEPNSLALQFSGRLPLAFVAKSGDLKDRSTFTADANAHSIEISRSDTTLYRPFQPGNSPKSPGAAIAIHRLAQRLPAGGTGAPCGHCERFQRRRSEPVAPKHPHVWPRALRRRLPGIQLVYYGSAGKLEHDFLVDPGANPAQVRWRFTRARHVRIGG